MKKIPSVFIRDWQGNPSLVTNVVDPACAWALNGEGRATRKRDGTACRLGDDGRWWRRYDAKYGKQSPPLFEPCQPPDEKTGHWPGWVPLESTDRWHLWTLYEYQWRGLLPMLRPGTYELCGPAINGNAERLDHCVFFRHGLENIAVGERTYDGLRAFLEVYELEGIVFHHDDGRMAKLKRTDLGLEWPIKG